MRYGYIQQIDIRERFGFLLYAMSLGQGDRVAGQVLYDVDDYASDFFDEEEQYVRFLFPEDEARRCAQRQFLKKIASLLSRYERGIQISPLELSVCLEDWIMANMDDERGELPSEERCFQGGR